MQQPMCSPQPLLMPHPPTQLLPSPSLPLFLTTFHPHTQHITNLPCHPPFPMPHAPTQLLTSFPSHQPLPMSHTLAEQLT